jgi:NodT family efflux transporter outer membrane factor (OMF) lipoprotein
MGAILPMIWTLAISPMRPRVSIGVTAMPFRRAMRAWIQRLLSIGAAALMLATCGCTTSWPDYVHNGFKVGPNYKEPPAPLTTKWVDEGNARVRIGDPNLATWWDEFDDPILNVLIERSCQRNLSLRAAGYQILQAEAAKSIAIGELFPQSQAFGAQITRVQASANQGAAANFGATAGAGLSPSTSLVAVSGSSTPVAGTIPPSGSNTTTTPASPGVSAGIGQSVGSPGVSAGLGRFFTNNATSLNASWELDFWGLFRRNLESSNGVLDQSAQNYDEMVVLLYANVAGQYVQLRTLQKRLELARKNVALQEPLVAAFYKRYKAGIANSTPGYFQLKSNLDNTKALIPPLEASLRQTNNQLCILMGMPIRDLIPELGDGMAPDPVNKKERTVHIPRPKDEAVVVGIQGDLLRRRPDVLAAESQLKIQSAQIGIAEAELYPHFGINGTIGLAANSFNQVFSKYSWTGSIGPTLTWNILNYGRLLGNVRLQDYLYQQYVAQYQNTVLTANQDAENAMTAYLNSIDQAKSLQDSADAAAQVTNYYVKQLKDGYLPPGAADTSAFINTLFTTINFQVTQQDAAAQAEGNIALNLILLYRAMGGGWQKAKCRENLNPGPDDYQLPMSAPLPMPTAVPPRANFGAPLPAEVVSGRRPL